MQTLLALLRGRLTEVIGKAFPALAAEEKKADVAACPEEFGHYQCNSALRLAKLLGQNPRAIAQKIVDHLDDRATYRKVDIAGPGFINFTLSSPFLSERLNEQLKDPLLGAMPPHKRQKIVVDFSSPNIAKELHVGHIRSTIIGDCLARLFEFLKQDVLRLNHIGDWGTQFGMLITYMFDSAPAVLKGEETTDLVTLMNWYKAAKKRFDADPEFKKKSQFEVVRLQSGEKEAMKAWKIICDISRKGFQEIYDLMQVRLVERGESFYNPLLKEVVDELDRLGLVSVSDGAKCIFLEGFQNREGEPLPLIIQKSDGGYNYDTTDLATIRHRIFVEKADRIIIVTDSGQSLHFQMVIAAAIKAKWLDPKKVEVDHVGFGLVLGPDGKKFKTRSGETEKLIDLLTEAVDKAKEILIERKTEGSPTELAHLAKVLGIGAIKYADLSSHRTKDYTFSYDRMLRFEGNTAVFLLYAYVRINGIKRKVHVDMKQVLSKHHIDVQHPSEIALGVHLQRFGETLDVMARDLLPNRLTDYLYELAEKFNAFFRDCRVEGSPEEGSRLILCELTSRVLKQGLEILGLETVERM
ncbi:MAG: arginine--tRNA ligase [Chlamydiae bacterium RIFCSPHIGHO2_12_FULL_49_9]|nr:MAG: arginine--tRNA ligase [Chlamydiae bacterium RIFCSPHIGHO2_12_FULL_49_9]